MEPKLISSLYLKENHLTLNFTFLSNITFIVASSEADIIYSILKEKCKNYVFFDKRDYLLNAFFPNSYENKVIVIKDADLLLNFTARNNINKDKNNQYIIIGADPDNLTSTNFCISSDAENFTLKKLTFLQK